jgi:hypothetical protein
MLLEGIKQWPTIGRLSEVTASGGRLDVSEICVMLQQLLYANAPADVIAGVLGHTAMYSLSGIARRHPSSFRRGSCYEDWVLDQWVDSKLWFYPPALMAAEKVEGLNREAVRNSSLPDVLSAAVNMNANNSKLAVIKAVRGLDCLACLLQCLA